MKVEGTIGPGTAPSVRKKKTAGGDGGFAVLLTADDELAASSINSAAPLQNIGNVLQLQEVDQRVLKQEKRILYGEGLLEYLDHMKLGLLDGTVSPRLIQDLTAEIRKQQDIVDDPALEAIMAEIETRAAVELAKIGKSRA